MPFITGVQYSGVPVGTIMSFSGANAPARTLLCNGDTVPNGVGTVQGITANFSALFAVLGSTYGAAGRLPDTRNVFLRGANASTRVIGGITYPAVTRGATVLDKMQGHKHGYWSTQNGINAGPGASGYTVTITATTPTTIPENDGTNGAPRTGSETSPVNLGVNYCIAF